MVKKELILDSSFLMVVSRSKLAETLPLESMLASYKLIIPRVVMRELEKMSKGKSSKAKNARLALEITQRYETIESASGNADDMIMEMSRNRKAAVATLDSELISSLRAMQIPVVTLRKNRLVALGASL